MGSSIYHVGWQNVYYNSPTEFDAVSHAYNECRRLALARLLEEAQTAGADAVVGVRIAAGRPRLGRRLGRVRRRRHRRAAPRRRCAATRGPVLTDLDGQEFWQLCAPGIRPVGIVAATSVHYAPAGMQTVQRA